MPRPPLPLPDRLHRHVFSVAEAPEVSRSRLRASDLAAPFYGVRTPADRPPTLIELCHARTRRLPGSAFISHLTAARLHRLPLPQGIGETLHISLPAGQRAPRGHGIVGHALAVREDDVCVRSGLRVTTPARTFRDLGGMLTLAALVAIGDVLMQRGVLRDELGARATGDTGARGRVRLLRAMELLDAASESPKEPELRVMLIEAGFPVPVCNHTVRDGRGLFVARVDLAYVGRRIAIEYEGDHHRDKAQWRQDLKRRRRLEALGWRYLSVTQADLDQPAELFADLRVHLAA